LDSHNNNHIFIIFLKIIVYFFKFIYRVFIIYCILLFSKYRNHAHYRDIIFWGPCEILGNAHLIIEDSSPKLKSQKCVEILGYVCGIASICFPIL